MPAAARVELQRGCGSPDPLLPLPGAFYPLPVTDGGLQGAAGLQWASLLPKEALTVAHRYLLAPSSTPEPGQTWTSRSIASIGATKANIPVAEVFTFRK